MKERLTITLLELMFAKSAAQIRLEHEHLSKLDSIGGDGDHGTAMLRAFEMLEKSKPAADATALNVWLKDAGWRVLDVDGGASTAILGTFIAGMGDAEVGLSWDCPQMAASLRAGLTALEKQTKARRGDKTMMDALVPAVEAFCEAASVGREISEAMQEAEAAAVKGADSTKDMIARYGRAKFLGEKTRGSPDAGATSVALLFRGFSMGLSLGKEE
jgi:dihydroxyacetone kinase-like protein